MIMSDSESGRAFSWIPGLLEVLKRRRYVLILPVFAGLAIGLGIYDKTPVSFVSEAVLALDARRVQAVPTETVVSPLPQDSPVLRTELDIISSRSMAAEVIDRLEAGGTRVLAPPQISSLLALSESLTGWVGLSAAARPMESAKPGTIGKREKIDQLLSGLRVSNDGRSYTIFISFRSSDPVFSAKVANAYANAYLEHQIEVQRSATRRVSDWLGEKLVSLRAQLEASERAAENFRQNAGLLKADGSTVQAQRVSSLNSELNAARSNRAGLQARLDTLRSLSEKGNLPALADILNSRAIESLRNEEARLSRKLDELRDSGALKSSQIGALGSELAAVRQQIAQEVKRVTESLANEISVASRKETGLEKVLAKARVALARENHAEVSMAQLEREASADRSVYESYLVRYKQTIEQDGIASADAQIISPAEPATARTSPRLRTWLLFGLALGGSVSMAGIVLREATDRHPHLAELLYGATRVAVVAALPRLTRSERRKWLQQAGDATTSLGRSLSGLRMFLRISPTRNQPMTVLFVSTFWGEGRTTAVLAMARSAMAAGIRTVVVDADLREPGIAASLRVEATAFIDEIVGMDECFDRLVQTDPASGVQFVAARRGVAAPEKLLAGEHFKDLLRELQSRFDLVLIDAPGLNEAPDAIEIASLADKVLFVMHFNAKRLKPTIASIRGLISCGHTPEGIILNRTDRHDRHELVEHAYRIPAPWPPQSV